MIFPALSVEGNISPRSPIERNQSFLLPLSELGSRCRLYGAAPGRAGIIGVDIFYSYHLYIRSMKPRSSSGFCFPKKPSIGTFGTSPCFSLAPQSLSSRSERSCIAENAVNAFAKENRTVTLSTPLNFSFLYGRPHLHGRINAVALWIVNHILGMLSGSPASSL